MSKEYPWGKGTPMWVRDATANDSDKSFTVPTGKTWVPVYVAATLLATATVGNRVLQAEVRNAANENVLPMVASPNIAASQSGTILVHRTGVTPATTARKRLDDITLGSTVSETDTLPDMIMTAGMYVRVRDASAVDAAADDLTVVLHYVEYDA